MAGSLLMPTSSVEMTIRCQDLVDRDFISKSDPVAIIFGKSKNQKKWKELWRSEMILNNVNPAWKSTFVHDYKFEENQPLKIEIHDWDTNDVGISKDIDDQDLIGKIETSMAALVSSKQFSAVLRTKSNKGGGKIFVVTEEQTSSKEVVKIHFAARDLDNKDTFGKSDPFLIISKKSPMMNGETTFTQVHQTNYVRNSLNPSWDTLEISMKTLCNGDYARELKFDVFDYDSANDPDLIGSFITDFNTLKSAFTNQTEFQCINPKKAAKKKSYKDSGKVYIKFLEITIEPSFLDYIQSGTMMNFSVAVDFTASNGHPR